MKVRELIAQLQDDIDPEAEIVMSWRHADGSSEGTAINHIEAGRSMVAGLLRPRSDPMKVAAEMAEADVIFGEYRGKRLEETSQRLIVTLMADNGDELGRCVHTASTSPPAEPWSCG
jgi:hypothetical protein